MSNVLSKSRFLFISFAISFCGFRLGELAAKSAYAFIYGNEADEEFYAGIFEILVGAFLFIGMPVVFHALRLFEGALHKRLSRYIEYGITLSPLVIAVGLLAGNNFDFIWTIFLATTVITWVAYCETMIWLLSRPRRTITATGAAGVAVAVAVIVPKALHLLDVQPDWTRHGVAAAMLAITLITIAVITVSVDRRRPGSGLWWSSLGR
jgi:hypothetical protein